MGSLDTLAAAVEAKGHAVEWYGPSAPSTVDRLQQLLGLSLPPSFVDFLVVYGGGGLVNAPISGIWRGDPGATGGGTVLFDTQECRSRFALPEGLAVVHFDRESDEVCWCIDCRDPQRRGWPIVSYDVFHHRIDATLSADFGDFVRQHFELRAS